MMRPIALLVMGTLAASAQTILIRNATVHTLAGEAPLEGASVLIDNGKITGVGRGLRAPKGAEIIEAKGKHLYPGMFDAFSVLGLAEIGAVDVTRDVSEKGDFNPQLEAVIGVNPESEHLAVARANGITHAVTAMTGGVMAGQAGVIHLDGWTWEEMAIERGGPLFVEWPAIRVYSLSPGQSADSKRPTTFKAAKEKYDKEVAEIVAWLDGARQYAKAKQAGLKPGEVDRKLEALLPYLAGERPLLVHADREREIRDAVAFTEEQGLKMILLGGEDAAKAKDLLAEKSIPVILGPTQSLPPREDDAYDAVYAQPGELAAAGVKFAFATFTASDSRTLPYEAAAAIPFGLPKDEALKAITRYPAEILGLGDRLGTIEEGKIANLILTDGDPLEITTQIEGLFIQGKAVSTDNKQRRLYEKYRARP
ncbi:MAG: amidohydrolase family protein [Acidobacteria bacterium]|nr:amidohydrolase family protein [Acidobacteriota bacterium]